MKNGSALLSLLITAACSSSAVHHPDAAAPHDASSTDTGQDAATVPDRDAGVVPSADAATSPGEDAGAPDAEAPVGVFEHHNDPARSGAYIDPKITKARAAHIHRDATFDGAFRGYAYAQVLYFRNSVLNKDLVIQATEQNTVVALDARDGRAVWTSTVGTPFPGSELPCGNIGILGITGTPVIDPASRTIYLDGMTKHAAAPVHRHMIFALSLDDGSMRPGWPVDLTMVNGPGGLTFNHDVQSQRGALALVGGILYAAYGGMAGDCGVYHGWVVGVPVDNPSAATAWATRARGSGIWSPAGVSSDGSSLYVSTGNGISSPTYQDQNSIIRLSRGPVFSDLSTDFFAPGYWASLDGGDLDLSASSPVIFDVAGATPSALAFVLGKDAQGYLVDRRNMGGVGPPLVQITAGTNKPLSSAAVYRTSKGTFIAMQTTCPQGMTGDLVALKVSAESPPKMSVAWCASMGSNGHRSGSPIVTMTDRDGSNAIVWIVSAEGDSKLRGFDAETGSVIFDGAGTQGSVGLVRHFMVPIAFDGRIFIAGDDRIYAFAL